MQQCYRNSTYYLYFISLVDGKKGMSCMVYKWNFNLLHNKKRDVYKIIIQISFSCMYILHIVKVVHHKNCKNRL